MQKKGTIQRVKGQQETTATEVRMLADMAKRGYSPLTQKLYLRGIRHLAKQYPARSLEQVSLVEAQAYVRQLKQRKYSASVVGSYGAAIRFLFEVTFGKIWNPVSPLRQRMLEDMDLHGFSVRTQTSYTRSVAALARYHNRSPDKLSDEEIRQYFVHLKCERKLARQTITIALCGIKFFIQTTMKRDFSLTGVPVPKRHKKLPVVLARSEVLAILKKVHTLRLRACLHLIYACGLRLGEACRLAPGDIDSKREVVILRTAKGGTDRQVPLPPTLLPLLREYWKTHKNQRWLFPAGSCGHRKGSPAERHMPISAVQKGFQLARKEANIKKAAHVHTLRHSWATHLLELGINLRVIQEWMGHRSPLTTSIYTHMTEQGSAAATQQVAKLMSDL